MKNFLPFLAGLLPFMSSCQQKPTPTNNMNSVFDKAVKDDTEIKVVKSTTFPPIATPVASSSLKYEPGKKYYGNDLQRLDSDRLPVSEKIQFIKDALTDTKADAFQYVEGLAIKFWMTNPEAKALIDDYFKKKAFEKSNIPEERFKYTEFRIRSRYPEAYQLIIDYFNTRDQLPAKYYKEGEWISDLITLGKEEEAVKYLEILAKDFINKKVSWLYAGNRDIAPGLAFDNLCLSDNPTVSKKATDILFDILNNHSYERYSLFKLAAYLDKERYHQVLIKWFKYYANLDFSAMNIAELKKDWHREARKVVPESQEYIDFMSGYTQELGALLGKQLWEEFMAKVKYTQYYPNSPFEDWQLSTLKAVFANPSVQTEEKKTMLFQAVKSDQFFKHGNNRNKFLPLLNQVYPGLKIPPKDFEALQLKKIPASELPLKMPDPNEEYVSGFLTREKAAALLKDINSFASANSMQGMEVSKKQMFFYHLTTREGMLFDFFKKNTIQSWFDCETATFPADYTYLFENEFRKNMGETGKKLQVAQVTKKISDDEYAYELYVKYDNSIYKTAFTENGTDWYNPQRLTKLINLCLAENPGTKRLVAVDTQDQTAMFVFIEPVIIKPLLDKYNVRSMAMSFEDAFSIRK